MELPARYTSSKATALVAGGLEVSETQGILSCGYVLPTSIKDTYEMQS